ncbi:hypothetical protein GH714_033450 [Hevea brasiliensis]|uniref:Rx N-terminal domain-containing protein n=1 Tax=Hevea brasiliensis TaxID=3981 RepID=A0A6A6M2L0_HEVBR|nr:hypothetical protein GH714_033450 [Hevea brasiliensis]
MALVSFASIVAEQVLEKLASNAYQELSTAWGVKGELKKLEGILKTVSAVLLDAEEKQVNNHQLRVWLDMLKDVLYDAEDVLDEFECETQRKQVLKLYGTTTKKQIMERLDEIASQKSKFHLVQQHESRNIMPKERATTHSFIKESDVIGRDKDKENIIRLLQDSCDGGQISIIPIVGIGEDFDIRNLTKKIIKCTEDGKKHGVEKLSKMEMEQLQRFLQEIIRDKKYLLILDDVWNDDLMKWNELKELLCTGANGSKILVTTRSNKVASIMGTTPTYELKGLSNDECMDLFTRCNNLNHHTQSQRVSDILLFSSPASFSQSPSTLLQGLDHVRTALFWENSLNSTQPWIYVFVKISISANVAIGRFQIRDIVKKDWVFEAFEVLSLPEKYVNKKVSDSICKLQNLQLLALRTEESSDIRYLINLDFLYFSTKQKCLAKNGLGCLTSLRSLCISECENLEYLFEDVQGLKHLRILSIYLCTSLISLPQNLKYLTALETLAIADCENLNLTMEEGKDYQDLARFRLQKLSLVGLPKLVEFPEWLLRESTTPLQLLVLKKL